MTQTMKLMTKYPVTNLADEAALLSQLEEWGEASVYAICKSKHGTLCSFLTKAKSLHKCVNQGDTWYIEHKAPRAAAAIDGAFLTNYVTYHIMADCGCLCNKCLGDNASEVLEASREPVTDRQWEYSDTDINYENKDLYCDHCSERIEASYE